VNIGKLAVTRPVAVTMRIAALVLLGIVSLTRLPLDLLPKVALPTVVVNTTWPNVAPEEMETQVTRPIEQAVSSASNVYLVSSQSSLGNSSVRIQFNYGTDISLAAVDVLQLVERARGRLPVDPTLQPPAVFRLNPSQLPILIFGVSGIDNPAKLKALLVDSVAPILQSAEGVASANVNGGADRAIIIDVDPAKLRAMGISMSTVSRRIVEENLNLPAGIAKQGATEYTIRSMGTIKSLDTLRLLPIPTAGGQQVRLSDIAEIRDASRERRAYTRLMGENSVALTIVKQSEANTVETAANVRKKIEQVKRMYPDLTFGIAYDQSTFIEHAVEDVKVSAMIGSALAIAILMMFLRNFRSTMVVALSIPISIISTFTLFWLCGFTLNTLTLSGLSLATGLIVDDAVVVLENIFRHIERDKKSVHDAAIEGTNEITSAVVASTITIMVVFLPLFLIRGQAGQLFTQFALVVIFSIAVSLLDALTVVPMLASRMIKIDHNAAPKEKGAVTRFADWLGERFDALDHSYRDSLRIALKRRWVVILFALSLTGASLLLIPYIGQETLPQTDSGNLQVNLRMPVGTALSVTNQAMLTAEGIARKHPEIETVFAAAGSSLSPRGGTQGLASHIGGMTLRLKDSRKKSTVVVGQELTREMNKAIAGARINVSPYDLVANIIAGGNQNIELNIYGPDLKSLGVVAKDVLEEIRQIPGLESADVSVQDATPELQIHVDREKAARLGVSFRDVAAVLGAATSGEQAGFFQEGGFQYPIVVQVPETLRKQPEQLLGLPVASSSGAQIPVRAVARAEIGNGPNEVSRIDSQRYISIGGSVQTRPQSEVAKDIEKVMMGVTLPDGMFWDLGRQQRQRQEEFNGLWLAVVLAVALIYMLLASQFESFIYPLTILTTVPLSIVGVLLGLFLTGRSFGLTAFIGLLLLVGIVVKNGILLIEYTNQLRERGLSRIDAVLEASPTRLRPILMTSGAAVLGMLPLAMGYGKGTEIQVPLATAVIGGLLTSTVLTLFVVPVVYTLLDDLAQRIRTKG